MWTRTPVERTPWRRASQRIPETFAQAPEVIGGVAKPTLEGWILALLGKRATEEASPARAAQALRDEGIAPKDGAAMVRVVRDADLAGVPDDAMSLRRWLSRAASVLPRRVGDWGVPR